MATGMHWGLHPHPGAQSVSFDSQIRTSLTYTCSFLHLTSPIHSVYYSTASLRSDPFNAAHPDYP